MFRSLSFCCLLLGVTSFVGCGSHPTTEPNSNVQPPPLPVVPTSAKVTDEPPPQLLTSEEIAAGWISLFDGQTFFGWNKESEANWQIADRVLSVSSGEPGLLRTTTAFSNYQLKLEFRAGKQTNSGIFLRTAPVVGKEDVTTACYELNIAPPDNPFPTGSLVGRAKASEPNDSDDWQTYDVTVNGPQVTVKLNDKQVVDYTDPQPLGQGFIGLQLNSGKVEFRNIKLKPLGLEKLFNGQDLSGWQEPKETQSKFTVTPEGWMNVKNGRGYLESEKSFADFCLQLECISNAPQLNSGLFFRCIPGQTMNGYESQIHNGFKDGDRTQPVDCGTGGIFRRVNARRVVPNDGEWFSKTILATGPHIAVWVNGYQVTDWTDSRSPHENPRNGLRIEAGTLQIQGHDPTTDLSFRNLSCAEIPPR